MTQLDPTAMTLKAFELRRLILETVATTSKGHIGGAFSCVEILVALYYGGLFKFMAADPTWAGRDRFVMSKGHSGLALYAVLADLGFFARSELSRLGRSGAMLGEHPDHRTPGIEVGTGSLGNGLGVAAGMALAARIDDKTCRTVALLGDGECYEGAVWEAAQFAAHHRLSNLVAILDFNGQCTIDYTKDCNDFGDMAAKWRAFGWRTLDVDGHDVAALHSTLAQALTGNDAPTLVVASTVKGKGISYMEGVLKWHHGVPSGELLEQARRELSA